MGKFDLTKSLLFPWNLWLTECDLMWEAKQMALKVSATKVRAAL